MAPKSCKINFKTVMEKSKMTFVPKYIEHLEISLLPKT